MPIPDADSQLNSEVNPNPENILEFIDFLNEESANFRPTDLADSALLQTEQALELSLKHSYPKGQVYALLTRGRLLAKATRYQEALQCLNTALELSLDLADAVGIARAMQGIGNVYSETGQISKALEEYLGGYTTLLLAGEDEFATGLLNNICNCYELLGEYVFAIEYAEKYLALARRINSQNHISSALNLLGNLNAHLDDFPTALSHYLEALAIATQIQDYAVESWVVCNIGLMYLQVDNYTTGLHYFMQGLQLGEKLGDNRHQAFCCHHISDIFLNLNNSQLALNYAMKSLGLNEYLGDVVGQAYSLESIARIFHKLGDVSNAVEYARKSLALHDKAQIKQGKVNMLFLLCAIAEEEKAYPNAYTLALETLEIAQELSNSLHSEALTVLARTALALGNKSESTGYSKQQKALTKLIQKDERNKKAAQLLAASELEKTKKQAQILSASSVNSTPSLAGELFKKTSTLHEHGFMLAPSTRAELTTSISHKIKVTTFGRFSVTIDGRELSSDDWQRKKARDIFKILLINHRKSVTIDELIDFLWPDSASKNLIPTLWNSVSYIRKALEPDIRPHTPSSFIKIMDKSYMLDLGSGVSIDFVEFKTLLAKLHGEKNELARINCMEQTTALYTGDFLKEDAYEEWASYERESLKEQYLETLIALGNYYLDTGKLPEAITSARKAIDTDRVYEEAYELLFTALADNNQSSELAKAWKACQAAYKKELGSQPPKFLEKLAYP